jgi:hypothetical protein
MGMLDEEKSGSKKEKAPRSVAEEKNYVHCASFFSKAKTTA